MQQPEKLQEKTQDKLQLRLKYKFLDQALLIQSLTHTSYGHEYLSEQPVARRDNERLEFLGDSILDLVVSDVLLETFPDANEGILSKMRAAVVNEKTLAEVARSVGLNDCVRLGKGESISKGNEKPSILSSTLEALIAAIYLDGGFQAVFPVVRCLFEPLFAEGQALMTLSDHKTMLQEAVQARWKITPTYHLLGTKGPDHAKKFEIEVRMSGKALAVALGASKKEAEQAAARAAMREVV